MFARPLILSLFAACSAPVAGSGPGPIEDPPDEAEPATAELDHAAGLRAHLEYLADDLLEGRGTGTRGYDLAARYAISVFQQAGARPAGVDGTFLQPVPLRETKLDKASLIVKITNRRRRLTQVDEYLARGSHEGANLRARGELVFVGFGVVAPKFNIDDYAGVDITGKFVLMLTGAPAQLPTEPRAHYSSTNEKLKIAHERGAAGVLFVHSIQLDKVFPYSKMKEDSGHPTMTWMKSESEPHVAVPGRGPAVVVSPAIGRELMSAAGKSFDEVRAAADSKPARTESFAIPAEVDLTLASSHRSMSSPNVIAMIPGTDPALAREYVLLTAHLDHIGIGKPVDGDAIYNGAQDNATGSAMVLELARAFAARPAKRPIVFALLTAEEKGLVGSDYMARNPTVDGEIVGTINLDLVIMTPDKKVVLWGEGSSSLGPLATRAAGDLGFGVMPDPMPEQVFFVRSDHYSFVKQGVPALFLGVGFDNGGAAAKRYMPHYHKPSDQLGTVEVDYAAGARLVQLTGAMAAAIANAAERPRWNDGDFFGELFGKSE